MKRQISIEITQRNVADYPDTYRHEYAAVARYDGNEFHGEGVTERDAVEALKVKVGLALTVPPRQLRQYVIMLDEDEFSARAAIERLVHRRVNLENLLAELRKEVDAVSNGREHVPHCLLSSGLSKLGGILDFHDHVGVEGCWCGSNEILEELVGRRPL